MAALEDTKVVHKRVINSLKHNLHGSPEVTEGVLAQIPKCFLAVGTQHLPLLLHVALHQRQMEEGWARWGPWEEDLELGTLKLGTMGGGTDVTRTGQHH